MNVKYATMSQAMRDALAETGRLVKQSRHGHIALLPCKTVTATALEKRELIKATCDAQGRSAWTLTDHGWLMWSAGQPAETPVEAASALDAYTANVIDAIVTHADYEPSAAATVVAGYGHLVTAGERYNLKAFNVALDILNAYESTLPVKAAPLVTGCVAESHSRRGAECRHCGQPVVAHEKVNLRDAVAVCWWEGSMHGATLNPERVAFIRAQRQPGVTLANVAKNVALFIDDDHADVLAAVAREAGALGYPCGSDDVKSRMRVSDEDARRIQVGLCSDVSGLSSSPVRVAVHQAASTLVKLRKIKTNVAGRRMQRRKGK